MKREIKKLQEAAANEKFEIHAARWLNLSTSQVQTISLIIFLN